MLSAQDTKVYTDLNGLAKLKTEAKQKTPEAIKEVAKQFESVFVGMMVKSMRQASLAEGILDSSQSDFYRDMYDQQLSVHLAGEGGIGMADLIARQLSPNQSVDVVKNLSVEDYQRKGLIKAVDKDNQDGVIKNHGNIVDNKSFTSAEDFVKKIRPYAEQAAQKLGVDVNVLLSQSALETGWGKAIIKNSDGSNSHNLFNIKADKSWLGQQAKVATLEFKDGVGKKEVAGFRSYSSYQESFEDYVDFIQTNPRYQTAIKMTDKPEQYMQQLQQAGYATDPNYAKKVMKIYKSQQINAAPDMLAGLTLNKSIER